MVREVFANIDIIKALTRIVNAHTEYYQSDLGIDLTLLHEAAKSGDTLQDRTFYWLCRTSGTWCLKERNVFLQGSREHSTWLYYAEQESTGILAYAIELDKQEEGTDILDGTLTGNLYELDYPAAQEMVSRYAVPVSKALFVYENGEITRDPYGNFPVEIGKNLGKFIRFEVVPEDPAALDRILTKQREGRKLAKVGNLEQHMDKIEKGELP